jgi:hypothetical protein
VPVDASCARAFRSVTFSQATQYPSRVPRVSVTALMCIRRLTPPNVNTAVRGSAPGSARIRSTRAGSLWKRWIEPPSSSRGSTRNVWRIAGARVWSPVSSPAT